MFDLGKEAFSLLEAQYISEKRKLIAKKTDKLSVLEIEPFTLNSNSHQSIPSHKRMLSTQSHTGFWFWIFNCIQATGRPLFVSALGFPIYQKQELEVTVSLCFNTFITANTSFALHRCSNRAHTSPLPSLLRTTPRENCFLSGDLEIISVLGPGQVRPRVWKEGLQILHLAAKATFLSFSGFFPPLRLRGQHSFIRQLSAIRISRKIRKF